MKVRNYKVAEVLILRGADVSVTNKYTGYSPLIYACESGKIELVKMLKERGAKDDQKNYKDETPITVAKK